MIDSILTRVHATQDVVATFMSFCKVETALQFGSAAQPLVHHDCTAIQESNFFVHVVIEGGNAHLIRGSQTIYASIIRQEAIFDFQSQHLCQQIRFHIVAQPLFRDEVMLVIPNHILSNSLDVIPG